MEIDRLFDFQAGLLRSVHDRFHRYLFHAINWKQRMFGIRGLRGTGKTTLLLQYLKYQVKANGLYVTADHPWFYDNTLLELADHHEKYGGKVLLIDEIHKYPRWSTELKNIYDGYPGLQVIFTASSALDIQKGEADLSRRVISYSLPGLSLREYLHFEKDIVLPSYSLSDLIKQPSVSEVISKIKPLPEFKSYVRSGYFPFKRMETEHSYSTKLNQIINTVLESDLSAIESYTAGNVVKIKRLLGVISESVPFTPNISALAAKMKMSRDVVNDFIRHLEKAGLLNLLHEHKKGVAVLQKPDKIYLENTNFSFALKDKPETGSLRETFFLNQIRNAGHSVSLPPEGDFLVDDKFIFEIGGKSKDLRNIKNKKNTYLALDEIEQPYQNRIPLWMFGFLY